jgi:hypothetical protein
MKKILLPFAGRAFPRALLEFAEKLNTCAPALVTAAFVPHPDHARLWTTPTSIPSGFPLACDTDEDAVIRTNSIRFRRFCEEHELPFRIHEDRYASALPAIKQETRFADLLLLSSRLFLEDIDAGQPGAQNNELLRNSECPVLLAPDNAALPEELIFAYDGSEASVFAIKQFIYLFPEFERLRASLVYVHENAIEGLPDEQWIKELCGHRFRKFRSIRLNMHTDQFYDTWLGMLNNPWLVAGAYGRSEISMLFHRSFTARVIRAHNIPVFIAHL